MTLGIIIGIICAVLAIAPAFYAKKFTSGSNSSQIEELKGISGEKTTELDDHLSLSNNVASPAQLETVQKAIAETEMVISQERSILTECENKLEEAQQNVQKREQQQQETKSIKEEDETKLTALLADYSTVSATSVELEQKLAESLKELDKLLETAILDPDQKVTLQEVSEVLTSSGGMLRDLIMEHESINERLRNIWQQQSDLEEEYTKLVEQQLGN